MAEAVERQHADQHGHRRADDASQEAIEDFEVVHGLRLEPARPGLELAVKALDFASGIRRSGVERGAHAEGRGLADAVAGRVHALVHPAQHFEQADAVDVEDGRGVHVVARARRVTGHGQDVANAERVRAQQVGLDAHEIPVPAGEVHVDVETGCLAHEDGGRQHGHADAAERAVVDVDDLHATLLEELGALHELFHGVAARRIELHAHDEAALLELASQQRRSEGRAESGGLECLDHACGARRPGLGLRCRRPGIEHAAHRRDVLGRRPAAAADDARAGVDHPAGVVGHVAG